MLKQWKNKDQWKHALMYTVLHFTVASDLLTVHDGRRTLKVLQFQNSSIWKLKITETKKNHTHAGSFLTKRSGDVSGDKAGLSAVNFPKKNHFEVRFLLHFIYS